MNDTNSEPAVNDFELMLDSGAYSVWKQGAELTLEGYIDFVLQYKSAWTTVVNLDVIPGKPHQIVTPAEVERAAEVGWENYYELKRALAPHGITPIHVFHRGDDFKHLKKMLDECEYIGLAPKTDGSTEVRAAWLDTCMKYVTDDKGWPLRKLHGFGVGALELIQRYPWYSVDSTSWLFASAPRPGVNIGGCYVPRYGVIEFTAEGTKGSKHFDNLPSSDRNAIAQYLASKGVPNPRMLRDDYCLTCGKEFEWTYTPCCSEPKLNHALFERDGINIDYYLDIEMANQEPRPWRRDALL